MMVDGLPLVESGNAAPCAAAAAVSDDLGIEDARLERLKEWIMAQIEAKLLQKEESLWRRGQVEIRRLQLEQQQVASKVGKLQEHQATLIDQNQKMRSAIFEVTSKFEMVVSEMRQGIRVLTTQRPEAAVKPPTVAVPSAAGFVTGLSPPPSAASTTASEVARDELQQPSEPKPGTTTTPGTDAWSSERLRSQPHTQAKDQSSPPLHMWHARDGGLGTGAAAMADEAATADTLTFCTPPRATAGAAGSIGEDRRDAQNILGLDTGGTASLTPGSMGSLGVVLPPPMPRPSWQPPSGGAVGASPTPAVLSLASALQKEETPSSSGGDHAATAAYTSAATPTPAATGASQAAMALTPSPGLKRLHLAECLVEPQQQDSAGTAALATPPIPLRPNEPSPFAQAGQLPAALPTITSSSPALNFDFATIELVKETGFITLGMEVNQPDNISLRVESIDEHGLVGRHNARQDSDEDRMSVGDRIIEVNGVRADPTRMLQECKVRQSILLTIVRDPPGAARKAEAHSTTEKHLLAAAAAIAAASSVAGVSSAPEDAAAAATSGVCVSPLPAWQLRPDAQVFVPLARKDSVSARATPPPPGLQRMSVAAHGSVEPHLVGIDSVSCAAAAASGGVFTASIAVATPVLGDSKSQEVVKCLFH